jgi:hypothetical protein
LGRTVRVVLFAGEEQGLVGSRDYARRARERGDDIRAVLNMDMVGYVGGGPDDVKFIDRDDSRWMYTDAARMRDLYVRDLILTEDVNPFQANSDHFSFWQEGYKAAMLYENDRNGVYPHYHKTTDTADKVSADFIAKNARLAAATAAGWAGLLGVGPTLSLDRVRVYPNPFKPGRSAAAGVTFDRCPGDATLAVFNLAGEKVAAATPDSGGVWVWEARVASGVYLYLIERDGERRAGKVAVIN